MYLEKKEGRKEGVKKRKKGGREEGKEGKNLSKTLQLENCQLSTNFVLLLLFPLLPSVSLVDQRHEGVPGMVKRTPDTLNFSISLFKKYMCHIYINYVRGNFCYYNKRDMKSFYYIIKLKKTAFIV